MSYQKLFLPLALFMKETRRGQIVFRKPSLESNADTQAVLKIVGGAWALSEESRTDDIISERDDYVARVESQHYVTVRIELGNGPHVQR